MEFYEHHTGIISDNLKNDIELYKKLGYTQQNEIITDTVQNNNLLFLKNSKGNVIELIQPLNEHSTVKNAKAGYHHICYETDNLDEAIRYIKDNRLGVVFTDKIKACAFNDRFVVFVYLKNKTMIELLERC